MAKGALLGKRRDGDRQSILGECALVYIALVYITLNWWGLKNEGKRFLKIKLASAN